MNKESIGTRFRLVKERIRKAALGCGRDPEEIKLVEETMKRVDEKFPGIEICSLKREESGYKALFQKFMESIPKDKIFKIISLVTKREIKLRPQLKDGLTLIGPSNIIKKIKREKDYFKVLAEI